MIKHNLDELLAAANHLSEYSDQIKKMIAEIENASLILFPPFTGKYEHEKALACCAQNLDHAAKTLSAVSKDITASIEGFKGIL